MHTMQDDDLTHEVSMPNGYGDSNGNIIQRKQGPQLRDTVAAVVGMLIPLVTQFGHHH